MDEAIKYVCGENFHRRLWLPVSATHDRLRVTYSTTSNFSDDSLPAILFCGPMFGSRWFAILIDHLAATTGVRVICVDRPGMGGSTPVPLNIRIDVWLETVPAFLSALGVQHVSLLSHSAGTMYAFNTIYQLRDILDPRRPYLAIIAPWVHNEHSHVTLLTLASKIPAGLFSSWNGIVRLVQTRVAPTASWSGGILSSAANLFRAETGTIHSAELSPGDKYGVSEEVGECIDKLQLNWLLAESTTAGNDEALLCLKKAGANWGVCEDYEDYVRRLAEQERRLKHEGTANLKIDTFFAASDVMIGQGGQQYFERCWREGEVADAIDFGSTILPETDHDSALADLKKGALKQVFERIARHDQ
ncbi:hypothetical protein LTR36_001408 [Oleoguttula mirabilis]|uniref:AB hydrolase-1 domain-containing protein n=1 Tax=Oleoguttula mirabilis TaxID=1507867 RepID=A0AAV9JQC5_9PEZI|nr:hypothetical protein LTR36_001408 [Oleoguttula mirabilis]